MGEQQKRYTAQDMRQMVIDLENNLHYGMERVVIASPKLIEMVRQSADTEDELSQLKVSKERWMQYHETAAGERNACIDELRKKDAEIVALKERLAAVVNMLANVNHECRYSNAVSMLKDEYDAILRAARGEGGAV